MYAAHDRLDKNPIKHGLLRHLWFHPAAISGIVSTMLETFKTLPDDPAQLRTVSKLMVQHIQSQAYQIEKLKAELNGHRRARFGTKSETSEQLALDLQEDTEIEAAAQEQEAANAADEEAASKENSKQRKRTHNRAPLPKHLKREQTVISPGETCGDCGGKLRQLGEDVTEELDYVPGHFVVRQIVRPRMACNCCEAFVQAELPSRPITRGRGGPGLLAHVLVSKYSDHLPLYRQSEIYAREKVDLHRSTLTDWVGRSTSLLAPLADHIGALVRAGPALFADDTPLKLQTKGKTGKTQTARMWCYVRDERPWVGEAPPCAWYQFSADRKGEHPVSHLTGYKGCVHADGFAGFNGLFGQNGAREQACMAHVRRKFVEVYEREGSTIAGEAIKRIAKLYAIEKAVRGKSAEERAAVREEQAKPLFDALEAWLADQLPKISGKSKLAEAIRYAQGRMPKARAYLADGRFEIDNNICENKIRPVAVGRKNYRFVGSQGGGKAAAVAYTLIETARMNGVKSPSLAHLGPRARPGPQNQPYRRHHALELHRKIINRSQTGRLLRNPEKFCK